jgi:hypothetical protein
MSAENVCQRDWRGHLRHAFLGNVRINAANRGATPEADGWRARATFYGVLFTGNGLRLAADG